MKRTPLRKVNPERIARLREVQFGGEYRDWIVSLPCCSCGKAPPSTPSHVKTRGSGGKAQDQVPHCPTCHDVWELLPIERKERFGPVAAMLWHIYAGLET